MYSMSLVKGADAKLPLQREQALKAAEKDLYAKGKILKEAFEMDDATYKSLQDAIKQGLVITDPNFPQIPQPKLDPNNQAHAELIKEIAGKGEDGHAYIDGLIDFHNYKNAMDTGRPYHSFFNAYMDGKTNGIASNGLQMGHTPTAYKTGVLRNSSTDLLDEGGDIRDLLGSIMTDSIEDGGFQNVVDELQPALGLVAKTITDGQHKRSRELNKHITMTYGYGKEIESFNDAVEDTIQKIYGDLQVSNPSHPFLAAVDEVRTFGDYNFAKSLLDEHYGPSMEKVNSPEGVEGRSIMRGAATMFALWDDIFTIKDPVGNDLMFGGDRSEGYGKADINRSRIHSDGVQQKSLATPHYKHKSSSGDYKNYTDPETGVTQRVPGQNAYGGSIPGPVQSIDAATVARL